MITRYGRVVLDLGTGDGRAVLRRARQDAHALVIGLDADGASMRQASARAAKKPRKGGLPNALFIAASAEDLPGCLAGRIDVITVALPWGSLLRSLACPEPALLDGLWRTLTDRGELELLLSVQPTDHSANLPTLDDAEVERMLDGYRRAGFKAVDARPATGDDVERLSSSWAKRLGVPDRRRAWLVRLGRPVGRPTPAPATVRVAQSR